MVISIVIPEELAVLDLDSVGPSTPHITVESASVASHDASHLGSGLNLKTGCRVVCSTFIFWTINERIWVIIERKDLKL